MKNRPEIIVGIALTIFAISLFTNEIEIIKISFGMISIALSGYFGYLKQS